MIRAAVVDDEPLARKNILRFLRGHKDIVVVRECSDGQSAVEMIEDEQPDLVFLDIHLPEISGLELLSRVGRVKMPPVIFTTAHANYALSAFEADAVDYILKPFGQERFDDAIERYKRRVKGDGGKITSAQLLEAIAQLKEPAEYLERLPVMQDNRIVFIKAEDVLWIEASESSALLHTSKTSMLMRETLSTIQKKLDPKKFIRIHRSTIVNIGRIREISPWFNGYHLVVLDNGKELRMSRYQVEGARRLLGR